MAAFLDAHAIPAGTDRIWEGLYKVAQESVPHMVHAACEAAYEAAGVEPSPIPESMNTLIDAIAHNVADTAAAWAGAGATPAARDASKEAARAAATLATRIAAKAPPGTAITRMAKVTVYRPALVAARIAAANVTSATFDILVRTPPVRLTLIGSEVEWTALGLLRCSLLLLPAKDRARWATEWRGELAALSARRSRAKYIIQTLRGTLRLATALRRPISRQS